MDKQLISFIITMCLLSSLHAQKTLLYLGAGQSNAVGQGDSSSSIMENNLQVWEYRFNGDQLVPLKDPVGADELNFQKANTGSIWPAFAIRMQQLSKKKIVVAQAARGGSSCTVAAELDNMGTWDETGKMQLFDNTIKKAKAAIKKTGVPLQGIIWLQGERDANAIIAKQQTAEMYMSAMEKLITRFRHALAPDLPFYIVLTGYYRNHERSGFDTVRSIQAKLAKEIKNVFIIYDRTGDFEAKQLMKDEIHYNQQALNEIGSEIAGKIYQMKK